MPTRDDVERICRHLADRVEGNGSKRPPITKGWRDAARLMIDRDGHSEDEIHGAIEWCQNSDFWHSNVLSLPKLREKYDQMRLQANRQKNNPPRNGPDWEAVMARAAARDEAEAAHTPTEDPEDVPLWKVIQS